MNEKKIRIILYAMMAVIIVLLCVSSYMLGIAHERGNQAKTGVTGQTEESGKKRDTVVNKKNVDTVAEGMEKEKSKPTSYEAVMNTEWKLADDGMTVTNAYVENSYENKDTVMFDVTLGDEEEPLYTSPEIPVGGKVTEIKFKKPVEGQQKATVTYHLLDKSGEETGIVKAGVTLISGE